LHDVETLLAAAHGEAVQAGAEDVSSQIGQFIYPGFLAGVGADRLEDVRRYLAAAAYRLRKLRESPQRDFERMTRVRILEDELEALMDSLPWSPRMNEISWMLQELRVSFFAQPVGAKGSVSEKRVRRALDALLAPD
jgi:ATP-dependent helicase HrpA